MMRLRVITTTALAVFVISNGTYGVDDVADVPNSSVHDVEHGSNGNACMIEFSIEVDDAEAILLASCMDEPQWVARAWCEALTLDKSAEGLPCTRMLAEEFIAKGRRLGLSPID